MGDKDNGQVEGHDTYSKPEGALTVELSELTPSTALDAGHDGQSVGEPRRLHLALVLPPIEPYNPVDGLAIAIVYMETTRALEDFGHRVTIVGPRGTVAPYDVGRVHEVDYRSPSKSLTGFVRRRVIARVIRQVGGPPFGEYGRYARRVAAVLAECRPDAVIGSNDWNLPGALRSRGIGAPVAVWWHNHPDPYPRWPVHKGAGHLRPDAVICVSDYLAAYVTGQFAEVRDRCHVVNNGVDHEFFRPATGQSLKEIREPGVVIIGKVDPAKGTDLAVAAVGRALGAGLAARISVAGRTVNYARSHGEAVSFTEQIRSGLDALGGDFLGDLSRSGVADLMRDNDICLALSRFPEGFPLVAVEAMASGCAIIASNRGGLPEAVGGAGPTLNPEDDAAVDEALQHLLRDPDALSDARAAALQRARQLKWTNTATGLVNVVAAIAN